MNNKKIFCDRQVYLTKEWQNNRLNEIETENRKSTETSEKGGKKEAYFKS